VKQAFPETVEKIVQALEDKKAVDIQVLDIRGIVSYTDYLVICSGTSTTHVNALVESVVDGFPKSDGPVYVNPSKDNSWWILDFVDTVVHVFGEETRHYYDLERLWLDAKK
jgi:ribosome-associated protein